MIGLTSITFRNKSAFRIIEFCRTNSIKCIEWGSDVHLPVDNVANARLIKTLCEESHIVCPSYGTYFKLGKDMDIAPYIKIANILDSTILRIWAGDKTLKEFSSKEYNSLVQEAKTIADIAKESNKIIAFEYHRNTLTETKESTLQLIKDIDKENVKIYWQPNPEITIKEQIEEIELLFDNIITVHSFHWDRDNNRLPLREGIKEWNTYISHLRRNNNNLNYLLEFCIDDSFKNAKNDFNTLKKLLSDSIP